MKKMYNHHLCLFLILWNVATLFPLPDQKIVYPDEWPYSALTALALEQGVIFFSGSPLTVLHFKAMLAEINEKNLSPGGELLYDKLQNHLSSGSFLSLRAGSFSFDIDALLQPEFYVRTDGYLDWIYNHYYRRSFISIPVSLSFSPYFNAQFEGSFEQELREALETDNYTNFPVNNFSMTIPHRAYMSFGLPLLQSSGIQFRIGIGEEIIGRTRLGSIILSDTMKDVTYAALSAYSPVLEYGARILQLDVNKYFYLHTLEARFFKQVSLAFVEGVMVNAPLELRFLNPLMVFHNFGAWGDYGDYKGEETDGKEEPDDARVGSFFALKAELQLFQYTRIYGIWALNELQTPGEKINEPRALRPDSFGFQAGFECAIPLFRASLSFGLEGVYTYPFMYVSRDKRWSFYKPENGNSGPFQYWTGTPLGPDSIAATVWTTYTADAWSLSGSLLFLVQGERAKLTVFDGGDYHPVLTGRYEDTTLRTPTGIPAYTCQIRSQVTWLPAKWIALSCSPGYRIVINYDNIQNRIRQGFELALAVRFIPHELRNFKMAWK